MSGSAITTASVGGRLPKVGILGCALLLGGCRAQLGSSAEEQESGSPSVCGGAAEYPLRRLTRGEYERVLFDVLGARAPAAASFAKDLGPAGFATNSLVPVDSTQVAAYARAAEEGALAAWDERAKWLPCAVDGEVTEDCLETFFETTAARLLRRDLTKEERDELRAAFLEKRGASSAREGLVLLLEAILQLPSFLYRVEDVVVDGDAPDGGRTSVTSFEMATRLSFFLWGTAPDEELLARARDGSLATDDVLEAEVSRMLADPRADVGRREFFRQWLEVADLARISKDNVLFPFWNEDLKASLLEEVDRFVAARFAEGASFEALFRTNRSFLDPSLAELYGVAASGDGFLEVELPRGERAGLLTLGAVLSASSLAAETSPILRGKFVRTHLFCQTIGSPPKGLVIVPPKVDPDLTTRERFAAHSAEPACAGCHELMDPIGFGFQNYDAVGRFTEMDGRFPADARGTLSGTDVDREFVGVVELSDAIAKSDEAFVCLHRQLARFVVGRSETEGERCGLERDLEAAGAREKSLAELWTSFARSSVMKNKLVETREVSP